MFINCKVDLLHNRLFSFYWTEILPIGHKEPAEQSHCTVLQVRQLNCHQYQKKQGSLILPEGLQTHFFLMRSRAQKESLEFSRNTNLLFHFWNERRACKCIRLQILRRKVLLPPKQSFSRVSPYHYPSLLWFKPEVRVGTEKPNLPLGSCEGWRQCHSVFLADAGITYISINQSYQAR